MDVDASFSPPLRSSAPREVSAASSSSSSSTTVVPISPTTSFRSVAPTTTTTTTTTTTMNKRQQAAQRARMLALSKQLKTRLQYAAFKVEHGWSKQSLSEVENLFYKRRRVSGASTTPSATGSGMGGASAAAAASGSSPTTTFKVSKTSSSSSNMFPSTPTSNWRTTSPSPGVARKASVSGSHTGESIGGLVTPPMSGNTFPLGFDRYGTPSFASGLPAPTAATAGTQRRSPSVGATQNSSSTAQANANAKRSYADFWSKIGGNGTANAPSPGAEMDKSMTKSAS